MQKDVNVDVEFTKNSRGESIVVGDDLGIGDNDRVLTFSTPKLLKALEKSRRLNIDCTFKAAPLPNWAAVLIIFALLGKSNTPNPNQISNYAPPYIPST